MIQKALDWLAEQPEDAAELAELLAETVPRLGLNTQKSRMPGISRAATSKQSLQLLHADLSLMQRLQAARPMLVGVRLPAMMALVPMPCHVSLVLQPCSSVPLIECVSHKIVDCAEI